MCSTTTSEAIQISTLKVPQKTGENNPGLNRENDFNFVHHSATAATYKHNVMRIAYRTRAAAEQQERVAASTHAGHVAFRARASFWCRARNHVGTACGSGRQLGEMLRPKLGAMSEGGAVAPLSPPPSIIGDAPAQATCEPEWKQQRQSTVQRRMFSSGIPRPKG